MAEIILIDQIITTGRLRPASEPHVAALVASIARGAEAGIGHDGLREPIEVRPLGEIDGDGRGYALVSGLHRLEACRRLGRDSIAAVKYEIGEIEAQLLEVEENLVRADLTPLDRAFFVKRFREMFEAAYGEVSAGRPSNTANVAVFSEAAKERLGLAGNTLLRLQRIANALQPEVVERLRGTGWDENQKALLELCGVLPQARMKVLDRLLDPESRFTTMREAIIGEAIDAPRAAGDVWFEKQTKVFSANIAWRRRFWREAIVRDVDVMREAAEEQGYSLEPQKVSRNK